MPYVVSMRMLARGFACSGYVYSHAWRLLWAGVVVRIRVFGLQAYMDAASFCSGGWCVFSLGQRVYVDLCGICGVINLFVRQRKAYMAYRIGAF